MAKNKYNKGSGYSYSGGWGWWNKTTAADLKQEMTGTTAVFGRDKGIQVQFRGNEAKTEDGVVTFPNLDPDLKFDGDTVKLFRGWVDTEAALARFSDKAIMKTLPAMQKSNKRLAEMFKAVEAARVENLYTDVYVGAGKNLAQLSTETFNHAKRTFDNPQAFLPTAINMFNRHRMEGVFNFMDCKEMGEIVDANQVNDWVDAIEGLTSTKDALALAEQIVGELNQQPEPEPQEGEGQGQGQSGNGKGEGKGQGQSNEGGEGQPQNGQPSKGDKQDKGNESGSGKDGEGEGQEDKSNGTGNQDGEGDGDGEDSGKGEGQPDDGDDEYDGDSYGETQGKPSGKTPGENNKTSSVAAGKYAGDGVSIEEIINAKINRAKNEDARSKSEYKHTDEDGPYIPMTTQFDKKMHWKDNKWKENIDFYTKARDHMGAQLATSKRKLELMIASTQKISWDSMKDRGRLDAKRLVGAYQGDSNVFKIKRDESDLDTCVSIVIDLSGSMGGRYVGSKSHHAFMSAVVLSELLSKIGVPFEINGFDCSVANLNRAERVEFQRFVEDEHSNSREAYNNLSRIEPLNIQEFKRFGDKFFDARQYMHRIASLEGAGNNNVDGESIAWVSKAILKRPEKRKIMFVLSDGQPAGAGNRYRMRGHLKRVIKDLERQIEVVGIGIESNEVATFYKHHIVINNSENLPATLLNLLGEKLLPSEKDKKKAA